MFRLLLASVLILLTGCALSDPYMGSGTAYYGRAYALPGQDVVAPPAAIVVLTQSDLSRNRTFCDAFSTLPTAEDQAEMNPGALVVPTRWLLRREVQDRSNCTQLLSNYDFARGQDLLRQAGSPSSEKGPFIIQHLRVDGAVKSWVIDLSEVQASEFGSFPGRLQTAMSRQEEVRQNPESAGPMSQAVEGMCTFTQEPTTNVLISIVAEIIPWGTRIKRGVDNVCTKTEDTRRRN